MSRGSYMTERALILAVLTIALIVAGAILAPHAHELERTLCSRVGALCDQRTDETVSPSVAPNAR